MSYPAAPRCPKSAYRIHHAPSLTVAASMLFTVGRCLKPGAAEKSEGASAGHFRRRACRVDGALLTRVERAMSVLPYRRTQGHRLRLGRESGQADGARYDRHVERHQHQIPGAGERPALRRAAYVWQLPPGTDHAARLRGQAMNRWLLLLIATTANAQTPDPQVDWVASWTSPTTLELSGHVEDG